MYQKLRPLTDALAQRAAMELNETPDMRASCLTALRDWVLSQPGLRSRTTDQFLIVFLRASKFNMDRAKQKLRNFYLYRTKMPEIFKHRCLSDPIVYEIVRAGCLVHLPDPVAPDGPRVVLLRPNCFDMTKHTIPDVFKVGTLAADILLYEDDNAIVAGYIFIMDLSSIPKSVYFRFDAKFARKLTVLVNKILPSRMRSFHFLHVPPIFEFFFNMVKGVINAKLRDRFYVHGSNYEKLYQHIPRHILPKEYGGDCDIPSLQEQWWSKLKSHEDFLNEEETFGMIETAHGNTKKPSSSSATASVSSGVPGKRSFCDNFRKRNVDKHI